MVVLEHMCVVFWHGKPMVAALTHMPEVPDTVKPPLSTRLVFSFVYGPLGPNFSMGMFPVALFYLVSGFVIPFSLQKTRVPGFLAARALRLWPTYAAGLTVAITSVAISARIENKPFPLRLSDIISNYSLGLRDLLGAPSIDGVVSTLEIEIKFYILLAACASMVRERNVALFRVVAPALCAPAAVYAILQMHLSPQHAYLREKGRNAATEFHFMIFMLIGTVLNYHSDGAISGRESAKYSFSLFTLSAVCSFLLVPYDIAVLQTCCNAKALLLFASCYVLRDHISGVSSLLMKLADISYSLYVTHGVFGYCILNLLIRRANLNPDISFAIAFPSVLSLATAIYHYVESPTQAKASEISRRWKFQSLRSSSSPASCVPLPTICKGVNNEIIRKK